MLVVCRPWRSFIGCIILLLNYEKILLSVKINHIFSTRVARKNYPTCIVHSKLKVVVVVGLDKVLQVFILMMLLCVINSHAMYSSKRFLTCVRKSFCKIDIGNEERAQGLRIKVITYAIRSSHTIEPSTTS